MVTHKANLDFFLGEAGKWRVRKCYPEALGEGGTEEYAEKGGRTTMVGKKSQHSGILL